MVGKPVMPYFCCAARFFVFTSSDCGFLFGKSSSTSTNFLVAASKAGRSKTSFFSLMHQPHQSLPVKSTRMSFFSLAATFLASSRSVSQVGAATAGRMASSAKASVARAVDLRMVVR